MDGYPLIWLVKDGTLASKSEALSVDATLAGEEGWNPNAHLKAKDAKSRTATHYLAANGFSDELESLLAQKRRLVSEDDQDEKLPIHFEP